VTDSFFTAAEPVTKYTMAPLFGKERRMEKETVLSVKRVAA